MRNNQAATMSVSLPKHLKEYIKSRTRQDSFGTPSDYIRSLIRDDLKRHEQERLEKMLLEGMASGSGLPMTPSQWKKLHKEARGALNFRK